MSEPQRALLDSLNHVKNVQAKNQRMPPAAPSRGAVGDAGLEKKKKVNKSKLSLNLINHFAA